MVDKETRLNVIGNDTYYNSYESLYAVVKTNMEKITKNGENKKLDGFTQSDKYSKMI